MKKHILCTVGKKAKLVLNAKTFYDFKRQISFFDDHSEKPVINISCKGARTNRSASPSTVITEATENSDIDEFSLDFMGSKATRSIEDSDIDSMIAIASIITKSVENSDADEFTPPSTKTTYTIENSDIDEMAFA